jgi:hypothetical protein
MTLFPIAIVAGLLAISDPPVKRNRLLPMRDGALAFAALN